MAYICGNLVPRVRDKFILNVAHSGVLLNCERHFGATKELLKRGPGQSRRLHYVGECVCAVSVGCFESSLTVPEDAPRQGSEGAPDAWIMVNAAVAAGLEGIGVGVEIIVITWLHKAQRDTLKTHPRNDTTVPLVGSLRHGHPIDQILLAYTG